MTETVSPLRVGFVYDMDACRGPTGVTRHALAQLRGLARHADVRVTAVSGRITEPDGLAFWESLSPLPRRELPLRTRNMLRFWRVVPWPPIDLWTGKADWVYSPAEYFLPVRRAKLAVTSHDVLQDIRFGGPRRRERLAKAFGAASLILSVSRFNTERLIEHFPECRDRVAYVPNAADDLFFEPATDRERAQVRGDLGLPPGTPYLLSVANFQERKNLPCLIRSAGRVAEVREGAVALVLLGDGSDAEAVPIRRAIADLGGRAVVRLPGYRQGRILRAIYTKATALVFPSLCESFGIPAVEAMACGCPVALADSTALPEVGGEAGWYFDPNDEEAMAEAIRRIMTDEEEKARRVGIGRQIAGRFRWEASTAMLVRALEEHRSASPQK